MDNVININNTKTNTLEFEMTIEGANASSVDCHFVISAKGQDFRFKAKKGKDGDLWSVKIPAMPYLEKTAYKCYTEVVADGQYFKPMDGNINVVGTAEIYTSTPKNKTVESDVAKKKESKKADVKREEKRKNESWRQGEKSIEQIAKELMAKKEADGTAEPKTITESKKPGDVGAVVKKEKFDDPIIKAAEKEPISEKDLKAEKVRAILQESGIKPKEKKKKDKISFVRTRLLN